MKDFEEARLQLAAGAYVLSEHAYVRAVERNISAEELRSAGRVCELLEEYLDDKYGPSCLALGYTLAGRPLHIQMSLMDGPVVKLITVYVPDPSEWTDDRGRR